MADMAHVLDEKFLNKLPSREDMELDPKNADHQELIEYW
jgi:hypothetical protein